jgi:glyoxylase-like metal-dependent hydrolase (beta-lactamase superfamily II)
MYIDALTALGVRCKAILETHMHADFVSGHFELSERLRAPVALGAPATLATVRALPCRKW